MTEKIFTTEQVANILQVHPFTILKFIKNGSLKGIKLGRVYRIKESDVEQFLEDRMTASSTKKQSKPKSKEPKQVETPKMSKITKAPEETKEEKKDTIATYEIKEKIPHQTSSSQTQEEPQEKSNEESSPTFELKEKNNDLDGDHYYII